MIDKLIEQQETIKGMQENEESAIKIMKMYEDYKLRVDKAIEYIEKNKKTILKDQADFFNEDRKGKSKLKVGTFMWNIEGLLEILKGEDKE